MFLSRLSPAPGTVSERNFELVHAGRQAANGEKLCGRAVAYARRDDSAVHLELRVGRHIQLNRSSAAHRDRTRILAGPVQAHSRSAR